ncbi:nucleoside/nucleotide kinase family protein [Lapillicoccus jejuensis]|uniref:Pantothenate kinase n=1 Tax=Lapillicoccus jejuensis TaxID=402171 RepID=A0A542DY61_9MICO|nr:nucleoside/nucleotide kinase family protein [Lapillicoccus jejuensis]TQJ08031.1 pantothenate kinase [Lapillicoccus jejuensis]
MPEPATGPVSAPVGVPQALVERALALAAAPGEPPAVLGLTGAPGAGKTTLAEGLLRALADHPALGPAAVAHLPMDGFHLADAQLDRLGRRDRKGAPDTFDVDGYAATLARVRGLPRCDVFAPGFERDLEQPLAAALVVPAGARLVVTEGNYLLLPEPGWLAVRRHLTQVWYVDLPDRVRLARLVHRHEVFGKEPDAAAAWAHGPDQVNARLVASTRELADLVVPGL